MNNLDQRVTPLFEAVINYAKEQKISFHTPGHKHGVSIPQEFINFVGEHIFDCDLTLLEEVDSLHHPRGVIKEAQALAAAAYQAEQAFFLVNGTTGGNQAMIMTACNPGDKIIIPRNAHRSVVAGIILAGASPIYVQPEQHQATGQLLNVRVAGIEQAVNEHPDAKAVLVTSPTYQGITADLKAIARVVHRAKMLFLVDEAHGPHLHFHPQLPDDAMACGADMCVQSSHKIISSLTQASLLLANKSINLIKLQHVLSLLMTTSPSYLLLASLDVARMQMATKGKELLDSAIALAENARTRIDEISGLHCYGREILSEEGAYDLDCTKLVVSVAAFQTTGYHVARELNHKFKIQVEFADNDTILLIISVGNTNKDIDQLLVALTSIASKLERRPTETDQNQLRLQPIPEVVLSPRAAFFSRVKTIRIDEAAGELCAETLSAYPPGIPIVNPGEKITSAMVDYLKRMHHYGNALPGGGQDGLTTIQVVCD